MITIIIPTSVGREKELKELLVNLLVKLKIRYEIIVAVDVSIHSKKIVEALRRKYKNLKLIYSPIKRGRCRAKNEAAKVAKGKILVFLDDDVEILSKNYFDRILEIFKDSNVGAASGREIKIGKESKLKKIVKVVGRISLLGEVISNFDTDLGKPIEVDALPGCNFAVRKDVFMKTMFDEAYDIGTAYREETDIQIRIKRMGYKLIFDPSIAVYHKDTKDVRFLEKWFKWYYVLNTFFFMKNFSENRLILLLFILKEFSMCFFRAIIYKRPHSFVYFPMIFRGIEYYLRYKHQNS